MYAKHIAEVIQTIMQIWGLSKREIVSGRYYQPSGIDQIGFFQALDCTGARRNPAAFGTNQGDRKRQFDPALRAGVTLSTSSFLAGDGGGPPLYTLTAPSH